jgi:hypothetical protein
MESRLQLTVKRRDGNRALLLNKQCRRRRSKERDDKQKEKGKQGKEKESVRPQVQKQNRKKKQEKHKREKSRNKKCCERESSSESESETEKSEECKTRSSSSGCSTSGSESESCEAKPPTRPAAVQPIDEGPLRDFTNLVLQPTIPEAKTVGCQSCFNYSRYLDASGHVFSYVVDSCGVESSLFYPANCKQKWFVWITEDDGQTVCYFADQNCWSKNKCGQCFITATAKCGSDSSNNSDGSTCGTQPRTKQKKFYQEEREFMLLAGAQASTATDCRQQWTEFSFWYREVLIFTVFSNPGQLAAVTTAFLAAATDIGTSIQTCFAKQASSALIVGQLQTFANQLVTLGAAVASGNQPAIAAALAALNQTIVAIAATLSGLCDVWRAAWITRTLTQLVVLAQAEAQTLATGSPTDAIVAFEAMLAQAQAVGATICAGFKCCGCSSPCTPCS